MTEPAIRLFRAEDRKDVIAAIADLQEVERALHDTRRPGSECAEAYFASLRERIEAGGGAILVAEIGGAFAGWAACFVVSDDNPAETPDSNVYGYISDVYVVPSQRGRRVSGDLLAAAERHLARGAVRRVRIGSLSANRPATAAYARNGFEPYEITFEKRIGGDVP